GACSNDSGSAETGARNDNYPGTHSGAGGSISGSGGGYGYGGGSTGSGMGSTGTGTGSAVGGASGSDYGGGWPVAAADAAAGPSPGSTGTGGAGTGLSGIAAGEWDDNANYREFLAYLEKSKSLGYANLDVSDRQFIVVLDAAERPVANCPLTISDGVHATWLKT